jgi:lipase ATG15
MRKDDDSMKNIFENVIPTDININTKKLLLPNICYSSVHNIPLYLYLPFINDAYYYNNIYKENGTLIYSSLNIKKYKNLFSNDDYKIDVRGNLITEENTVKMIQYNIKNKKNYITILSIKGTSYNTDIYLDAQLYFSSILLSLLSTFSLLSTKESRSFKLIEYSLNIPYRIFFKYLLIDGYLNKLQKAYIDNEVSFHSNVVIVGHSLGGGLAKLFGRLMKKQAISLSGPGVNAFHSLWKYQGESENFEISAIDLVPDMDLVPRVEVSGGTVYRIICQAGVLDCHSKHLSLCEVLIMCRNPNYEMYCRNVAKLNSSYIEQIKKTSELNN